MGLFKFAAPPDLVVEPRKKEAPVPALLRRGNDKGKDKGVAGRAAEKRLAKRVGGTQTPGSGAIHGVKGDVKVGDFLIENKTSTNQSFSVRRDHLHKVCQEALNIAKTPALAVQFVTSDGKSEKRDRWVMIPEATFMEFLG